MANLKIKILLLCLVSANLLAQKEFEKYGPFGCVTYTDLKEALKIETKVYKLDLSYKKLEPKLYEKLYKLKDLQALKFSTNEITDYPKNFEELSNLVYFASYNNKLTQFPPNLKPFNNLYYLDFHSLLPSLQFPLHILSSVPTANVKVIAGTSFFCVQHLHDPTF